MPFYQPDALRYYKFETLTEANVNHAIFTRLGGVSKPPWAELNVGATVGDKPQNVRENRSRTFRAMGRESKSVYEVWQVHSTKVVCTGYPRNPNQPYVQADAILTDNPSVTLFMRFADCVPILLYDPGKMIVGIVHAGWQGTVRHISKAAIQAMVNNYGSNPQEVIAAFGPAVAVHHYEVGEEVVQQVQKSFGKDSQRLLVHDKEKPERSRFYFDLVKANRLELAQSGVQHVEDSELCTACSTEEWYSHRAEKGRTGRFGAAIAL